MALQQSVDTYAVNLIYDVRLQVNVEDRLGKKFFQCVVALFRKKTSESEFQIGWTLYKKSSEFKVFYSVNKVKL